MNSFDPWFRTKSVIEDNDKRMKGIEDEIKLDLEKLKNRFIKDKFEIFIDIVCRDFNKSSTDHLVSLSDIVKLIQETNEVFDAFDNSISIEENVNNFYRNYKNNS